MVPNTVIGPYRYIVVENLLEVVKEAISAQQRQAPVMREVKKKVFCGECAQ